MKAGTVACLLGLLGAAGCSLGDEEKPKTASGPAREIGEVVRQLERAAARGDWQSVCDDVFTANARRRAGGDDCPRLLRSDAAGLRSPRIELLAITVKKGTAEVRVRSRARGQRAITEVIELRRERGEYRVEALRG